MRRFLALVATMLFPTVSLSQQGAATDARSVLDHDMKTLAGEPVNPAEKYAGRVVLVVNVASKCGLTPQYKGLEALYKKYAEQGLVVLGVPCNQFAGQEPGSADEIATFCEKNYGVTFDLLEKVEVNGAGQHPLYADLTSKADPPGPITWNFEKFLVAKDGSIAARANPRIAPDDQTLVAAIEAELAK
jgi:glutathione peroxidase